MEEWKDEWGSDMKGWMERWKDGWVEGWESGRVEGWKSGRMNGVAI